jgi:predicted nucleic acid-binding protein
MRIVVVDASAIAALLFGEPKAAKVAGQLRASMLAAPTLVRYEIGHACLKKISRYPERHDDLLETLSLFGRLHVQEIDVPPWEVVPLAEASELSFYDASYLWLSRSLGVPLVTLDTKLEAAASGRR